MKMFSKNLENNFEQISVPDHTLSDVTHLSLIEGG